MLQPRQQYGLGSLVKSAVKGVTGAVKGVASGIKDFAKSDLGKAAIMAGIGFGIPGTSFGGLFGRAGFGGNALGLFGKEGIAATLSGIPGAAKAAQFLGGEKTLGKTLGVFAGGSLLGGLLSKAEQGDPNAMQATRDVGALRNYLTEGYTNLGYSAEEIPALVEKDVSEYSSIGGYANGGRIGFANGVTPELMKRINAIIKEIESNLK
jgi:phage-related minor tail protein